VLKSVKIKNEKYKKKVV